MADDLPEGLFPSVGGFPVYPPPAFYEVWEQIALAQEIVEALACIDHSTLMTDERFAEILSHPSVFWGTRRRDWRILPSPMGSATRTWYAGRDRK